MARLHPSFPLHAPTDAGHYRERDVLRLLELGLPDTFDVFHNLPWSSMHQGRQTFGEVDLLVAAPQGHLLIIEVKAGSLDEHQGQLTKHYGGVGGGTSKDPVLQVRRTHAALLNRMQRSDLPRVYVDTLLVLPDHHIRSATLAYPRERIVDAAQMDQLCSTVQRSFRAESVSPADRQRLLHFLANRYDVEPDVSTRIGQVQALTTQLSSGLATWVPKVSHPDGCTVIQATAGSGKTQLALSLLREAAARQQRAQYVCFNRLLSEHMQRLAPATVEVSTFHHLCRTVAERQGHTPNFAEAGVFNQLVQGFVEHAAQASPTLDLLVVDESQDFAPEWVQALSQQVTPNGRLYVMGDPHQQLYDREPFELPQAVHIECMDNFRSPRQVVAFINDLGLTPQPIAARSAFEGAPPGVHPYTTHTDHHAQVLQRCLQQLWSEGYTPQQVVVLSFRGHQHSATLQQTNIAGLATRRFAGRYDSAGQEVWTEGELTLESLYRFKGQSAPVIVLCEVDFAQWDESSRRKMFVGMTRGQVRVEVVTSRPELLSLQIHGDK